MIEYLARSSPGKSRAFWCVWDEGLFGGGPQREKIRSLSRCIFEPAS
jgi:hypothetical protein